MADGRSANQTNRQSEIDPNTRMEMVLWVYLPNSDPRIRVNLQLTIFLPFSRSESPRVQQMLLHQNLRDEIERNSGNKVRYVDSELYFRNQQRALGDLSEIQSTTLNIGNINFSSSQAITKGSVSKIPNTSATTLTGDKDLTNQNGDHRLDATSFNLNDDSSEQINSPSSATKNNQNCQVCRIREVRQSLMNINKVVQERNEQIAKLKAKCLRSYSEKQVMD